VAFTLVATLTLLEIAGAWRSGSMALWGEAAHFVADAWAFAVAAYALTPVAPTSRLSYGRGQAVALGGLINGLLQGTIGVAVAVEAVGRFFHPQPIEGGWMLAVAALGLLVNLGLIRRFGGLHMHEEDAVEGARIHFLADAGLCLATVLAAALVALGGPVEVDAALALLAAFVMVLTAARLMHRVGRTLLASVPQQIASGALLAELNALPDLVRAHHLHVWGVGRRVVASVHLQTPVPSRTLLTAAQAVFHRHGVDHTTIQIETECPDNPSDCGRSGSPPHVAAVVPHPGSW
jgi:cobalt-zinc-cadmium efflux system protein